MVVGVGVGVGAAVQFTVTLVVPVVKSGTQSSNYIFKNGNIYAPGFGFGAHPVTTPVSPLEAPSLPIAVKVFRDTLTSTAAQSGAVKPKASLRG